MTWTWLRREGSATPRLLLHGFTGDPSTFDHLVDRLRPEEPLAALTLPGHSPDAPVASSFEENVDAVIALLDEADVSRVRLLGYSMGARVAVGLLVRHADRVDSACLVGVHPGLPETERADRKIADERWSRLLREKGIEAFADEWENQPIFASQQSLPVEVRDAMHLVRRSHDPERLAEAMDVLSLAEMPDYTADLVETRVPLHLVVGERDEKFQGIAESLRQKNPAIHVSVCPGAGHNVVLEDPAFLAQLL